MKFDSFVSILSALAKRVVIVVACATLILASATPAIAATSSPSKGVDSLSGIQQKTEESVNTRQPSAEIQSDTEGGLNRVQGNADKEKMRTPENSAASESETIEGMVEDFMDEVTGEDE